MKYRVEVRGQGAFIARHTVAAGGPLAAINLVECLYNEPVMVETGLVEDKNHRSQPVKVVNNWSGYTFEARVDRPRASDGDRHDNNYRTRAAPRFA